MIGENDSAHCYAAASASAKLPTKKASRHFNRQLTFIDVERSVSLAGEFGRAGNQELVLNGESGEGNSYKSGWNIASSPHDPRFEGTSDERKVAIITGATSGIGLALARYLHRRHYRIALVDHDTSEGARVASQFNDPASTQFFPCDVSSYSSQKEMFLSVWRTWERIDLCCLSADVLDEGTFWDIRETGNESRSVDYIPAEPKVGGAAVLYQEAVYGMTLAAHFMRLDARSDSRVNEPRGRIIVHATVGSSAPGSLWPNLTAAKPALVQYMRSMAEHLKQRDSIWLNCILSSIGLLSDRTRQSAECSEALSVAAAHEVFINDQTGEVGKALEVSAEKLVFYNLP